MASASDSAQTIAQVAPAAVAALPDRPPAGRIETVVGAVFVLKLDGSRVPAQVGATVFEGDILVTQAGAGTVVDFGRALIALGSDARMLVETGGAQPVFFVLQGQFGVQALAAMPNTPDPVTVRTPVGTVLLRHGRMLGRAAAEAVSNTFVLLPNGRGGAGEMQVTTAAGTMLLDRALQSTTVVSLFRSPMSAVDRDLASLQNEFGGILAGWLPAVGQVAAIRPAPQVLSTLLSDAGEALASRGSRLFDLIFPPAVAAAAFELTPGPQQDNTLVAPAPLAVALPPVAVPAPIPLPPSYSLSSGSASFQGTSGFDLFSLSADPIQPNRISIGTNPLGQVVITDAAGNTVLLSGIEELDISLGTAADVITLGDLSGTDLADSTVIIHAGGGDDTIDGSAAGKRLVLFGDDGNDLLIGGSKNDDLIGGPGNDTLIGDAGNDLLDGGADSDTVSFAAAAGPISASLAAGTASGDGIDTLTGVEHLIGSAFGDLLVGDGNANRLDGAAGNDTLIGGAGDDTLDGGDGRDTASFATATGSVTVSLAAGTASGDGADSLSQIEDLFGSAFDDTLIGDDGDNAIDGGLGDDAIDAQAGNDAIRWASGTGADTVVGGAGADTLEAAVSGGATLAAAGGAALVTANGSVSIIGVETLRLTGSAGSDTIGFGDLAGTDVTTLVADAAGGLDTASFAAASAGVEVDLAAGTASGVASFLGFEAVVGSAFADTLRGDAGNNTLTGGAGNDSLDGRDGDDLITWTTGSGNDVAEGGAGSDTVDAAVTGGVTLSRNGAMAVLAGGGTLRMTGVELLRVTAGAGGDTVVVGNLAGTLQALQLDGGAGTDMVSFAGTQGAVVVDLGASTATASGNIAISLQAFESATGSDASDTLLGSDGANTLTGRLGADSIDARGGDDRIVWVMGDGNDTIDGGAGADLLDVTFDNASVTLGGSASGLSVNVDGALLAALNIETVRLFADGSDDTIVVGGAGSDIVLNDLTGSGVVAGGIEVHGAGGDDRVDAQSATLALRLFGDSGDDTLVGGGGNDTLDGGGGADTVDFRASAAAVVVDLAQGTAIGAAIGTDRLNEIERVIGSDLDDTIAGGGGDETLAGGQGNDSLIGGGGFDMLDYGTATAGVAIDLSVSVQTATGNLGTDTVAGFEGIIGGDFDDRLTGDDAANRLDGGDGDDALIGAGGNDTLVSSAGADTLDGGDGIDTVDLSGRGTGQTVNLGSQNFVSIENLIGSDFADRFAGTTDANLLMGNGGNDTLVGSGGADTLIGGPGLDVLQGSDGDAQGFRYLAVGEGGDSIVLFESGLDRIEVNGGAFGVVAIVDGENFFAASPGDPLGIVGPAFLFDGATRTLAFDGDGDGAALAVPLVTLQIGSIQATDLMVF